MKRKIKVKQIKTKVSGVKVKALLEKAYIVIRPGGAVEILVRHKKLPEDMFVRPGSEGSMINLVTLTGEIAYSLKLDSGDFKVLRTLNAWKKHCAVEKDTA